MNTLYINIKNERLKKGWSQAELAKRVGYSDKSMIAKIEAGKVDLSETKVKVFADVFGCSESYLRNIDDFETYISNATPKQQDMIKDYYFNKELEFVVKSYANAPEYIKDAVCKLLDIDRSFFNIDKYMKEGD